MKDQQEEIEEIMKRSRRIRQKRAGTRAAVLAAGSVAILALLIMAWQHVQIRPGQWVESNYGSFILDPRAGGYVITAIIAFVLGAALITMIMLHHRKHMRDGSEFNEDGKKDA